MFSTNDRAKNHPGAAGGVPRHIKHSAHPKGGLPPPKKQYRPHPKSPNAQSKAPPPWGPDRSSATLPNPGIVRHQSRVRVQAGDKCVAPVKSKQKKRTAVPGRPVDHSGLSMDSVIWTDETFTTDQLMATYGSRLPVIVKIVACEHLDSVRDLSLEQVVQVHSYDKQTRVRAVVKSTTGKMSLPANYPIEVFTTGSNIQERLTLDKALNKVSIPFDAQVMSLAETIDVSTVNILGRHLTITERYEESFLRTNFINDGWIDQESIHAIPGFLGAVYSVAVGMRDASREEWADYYGMFARSVRHLNFHILNGYYGVIIEDDGGGTIETKVHGSKPTKGPVYENIEGQVTEKRSSTLEPKPSDKPSRPYENWSTENAPHPIPLRSHSEKIKTRPTTMDMETGFDAPPATFVLAQTRQNSNHESEDGIHPEGVVRRPGVSVMVPLPDVVNTSPPTADAPRSDSSDASHLRRPDTPFSDADESDVEEMFQSVLDVAEKQESLERERESLKREREEAAAKAQRLDQNFVLASNFHNSAEFPARRERRHDVVANKNSANLRESREVSVVIQPPDHAPDNRPSYRSSSSSRDSREIELLRSIEAEVHRDPSPRVSTHPDTTKDIRNLVSRFESSKQTPKNQSNGLQFSHGIFQEQDSAPASPTRTSNTAAAVQPADVAITISPRVTETRPTDHNANNKSPGASTADHNGLRIVDMDDVPKVIDNLDVESVCQCLRLLNMENHIAEFRRHRVDGNYLSRLTENNLVTDLKFTPFNASKLMRFARGWRPKLA